MGTLLQFGGLAIMPFALLVLSGDTHGPIVIGQIGAALAFLLVGAGLTTVGAGASVERLLDTFLQASTGSISHRETSLRDRAEKLLSWIMRSSRTTTTRSGAPAAIDFWPRPESSIAPPNSSR